MENFKNLACAAVSACFVVAVVLAILKGGEDSGTVVEASTKPAPPTEAECEYLEKLVSLDTLCVK